MNHINHTGKILYPPKIKLGQPRNWLYPNSMLHFYTFLLFLICQNTFGQQNSNNTTSKPPLNDRRKYASLINPASLRSRLEVLAADSLEGRETGEIGAQKAAAYVASRFKAIGLKPPIMGSYFQKVPLLAEKLMIVNLQVGTIKPDYLDDFVFIPSRSGNSALIKSADVSILPLPANAEEMAKIIVQQNLKDKVIMLIPLSDKSAKGNKDLSGYLRGLSRILAPLRRKSPAAILVCDNKASILGSDETFKETYLHNKTVIPAENKGISSAAVLLLVNKATCIGILGQGGTDLNTVVKTLSENGSTVISCGISIKITNEDKKVEAANVLGLLPGSDLKSEVLVVSAHYDHLGFHNGKIFHGADDDGSGTSALIEIAGAFSKAKQEGKGPRRSILFLANVGEEKGLLGSQYYSQHPVISVSKTIADLNIDMIGRIDSSHLKDSNYVYVIGSGKLSSELQTISESTNREYGDLFLDYKFDDPADPNQFYYRSDHYNFAKLNIPIIFYFNGVHADYHQPSDTIDKIVFGLFAKRARLVFYTAWELANRDERPVVDRVNDFK